LAARLAARKEAEAAENSADPDSADHAALEAASLMPEDPDEAEIDLGPATERAIGEVSSPLGSPGVGGLNITGLRTVGGLSETASRVSGLFTGSDSSDSEGEMMGFEEDDAGRDVTVGRKEGDFEDEAAEGMSPAAISSGRKVGRRRPSTTEAKERQPLDVGEEYEDAESLSRQVEAQLRLAGSRKEEEDSGPFADPVDMRGDSSDEDELVEIKTRRTS
jgi:hypothetical protein